MHGYKFFGKRFDVKGVETLQLKVIVNLHFLIKMVNVILLANIKQKNILCYIDGIGCFLEL